MTTASTREGGIWMRTDTAGRPLELHIDPSQMRRSGVDLAADLLHLCLVARTRAGVEQRDRLTAEGVDPATLRLAGLPTTADLARLEAEWDAGDDEVDTWMQSL